MVSAKSELIRRLSELFPDCQNEISTIVNKFNIGFNLGQNHLELQTRINSFIYAKRVDGCSEKTLKDYAKTLRLFRNYLDKPVEEITTDDLREYIYHLSEGDKNRSKSTIQTYIATLRSFFRWLEVEEIIIKSPMNKIKSIKIDPVSVARKPLLSDELEMIRDACQNLQEQALVEFLVTSGCRLSEVANLKLENINWQNRTAVVTGKGDKTRTVFFSSHAKFILQKYLKNREGSSEYLFTANKSPYGQLKPDSIYHIISHIGKRNGFNRNIFPHLMRHTFATNALHTGMDVTVVQSMMGHSDPKTTLIYAKINPERIRMEYNMHMNLL